MKADLLAAGRLLRQAAVKWRRDKADVLAASLAYYSVFSVAPLLMLGVVVTSRRGGAEESRRIVMGVVSGLVGPDGSDAVRPIVESAGGLGHGGWATVVGLATLIWGASSLFLHLQDALNVIWDAPHRGRGWFRRFLKRRLLSFALVLMVPLLILAGPMLTAGLEFFGRSQLGGQLFSLAFETFIFAFIFKLLPDAPVPWDDVWIGALFTASLFTVGQTLLGFYLNRVAARSVYGAAGSPLALLVWIHASAQILLFGAEFIQAYKNGVRR